MQSDSLTVSRTDRQPGSQAGGQAGRQRDKETESLCSPAHHTNMVDSERDTGRQGLPEREREKSVSVTHPSKLSQPFKRRAGLSAGGTFLAP